MNDFNVSLPIGDGGKLYLNCLDRAVWTKDCDAERGSEYCIPTTASYNWDDFTKWFHGQVDDCSEVKAVVFLTNRCNLSCRYCFQDGYAKSAEQSDLTVEVADSILVWLRSFSEAFGSKIVHLYLYGGEPTLNPELIEYLAGHGKKILEQAGCSVIGHMFTNGAVISARTYQAIASGFIRFLQITLDGTEAVHNRRRPFKSGLGSFRNIVDNVEKILKGSNAEITILSNFDRENKDSIRDLHCYLDDVDLADRLCFTLNPMFKTPYNCGHCNLYALSDNECYRVWSDLLVHTYREGFQCNPLPIFDKGPCSYWRRSHFVFDATGEIYKCIGMPGMKELSIGNVASLSPESIGQLPAYGLSGLIWDNNTCKKCPYLPLCLGGCRFHALVEYGDVKKPYCHKDLIEQCEFETIKKIYGNVQV